MHNSKRKIYPYIKRTLIIFLCLVLLLIGNGILNFIFIPYSYVQEDYHNVYTNNYDTIYLGTSHGKCGIVPDEIDKINGGSSYNMCLGGEYLSSSYYMLNDICRKNKPKTVVYELDPGYWVTDEFIGTDSALIFKNMAFSKVKLDFYSEKLLKEDFRLTVFPWYVFRKEYKMIPDNIKNKRNKNDKNHNVEVFANSAQRYDTKGFIYRNPVDDSAKTWQNFTVWDRKKVNKETLKYFNKLVKYCKSNDIELKVIITPAPAQTIEQYSTEYKDCNAYFTNLTKSKNIEFYDFNYIDLDGFSKDLSGYCDHEGHLNGENALIFSKKLAPYVK